MSNMRKRLGTPGMALVVMTAGCAVLFALVLPSLPGAGAAAQDEDKDKKDFFEKKAEEKKIDVPDKGPTKKKTSAKKAGPAVAVPTPTPRMQFKIDPRTAPGDLLPTPPEYAQRSGPVLADDLALVPEIAYQMPIAKNLPTAKIREMTAHALAKINHVNAKKADAFMQVLLEERADLAGLPMAMGDACRMTGERSRQFNLALTTLRRFMSQQPGAMGDSQAIGFGQRGTIQPMIGRKVVTSPALASANRDAAENFWQQYQTACLQEDNASARFDQTQQENALLARIAALMQVLAPESAAMREGLVKYLATIGHPEATRALARLAIHSADDDVHRAAIAALKVRRERDYTDVLVQGLRYPWPATAKRAADALVKLERSDLVPQLVAILEEADPRLPVVKTIDDKQVPVVRELVRINHHRNCLLCHAPGNTSNVSTDVVTAGIPVPGEPLPSLPQGYENTTPDNLVRVDVTYLRQDFSVRQPVADAHPWPELQRFDFLIRTRQVTEAEAQEYRAKLTPTEPGVLSPYHRVVLVALRELTGKDTEPNAPAWRRLLKLEKN